MIGSELWGPLYSEDHEAQAQTIIRIIKEEVSMHPCDERVGRMKWGIQRMIKRLEAEDTESSVKTARRLWASGHAMYPDHITGADEPKPR